MADQLLSMPFVLAIFVLYVFQIGLVNAERNSTEQDECHIIGELSLNEWIGDADEGVVFVCFENLGILQWGVVCTNYQWDHADAQVVCRQLGYEGSSEAVQNAENEFVSVAALFKDVTMSNVRCIGNETRLVDCKHDTNCGYSYASNLAGVTCKGQGNDDGGGFNTDFDNTWDTGGDNTWDTGGDNTWDTGGGGSSRSYFRSSTILPIVGAICFIIMLMVICFRRRQREARLYNQTPNATVQTFQMVPPNHPSNYEVGQHPPPGSAFPNSQPMHPPKSQTGQMMPPSYPNPYPAGAHQYPPPNPYPMGEPQYPPPNPYPAGAHQYPPPNPYPMGEPQYPPPEYPPPEYPPPEYPPPSQPNLVPMGQPEQYPPPDGGCPPGQPNPYQAGAQQY